MINYPQLNGRTYAELFTHIYHCSIEEVVARWSKEWDEHHAAVQEYFKDRPNDFLVFNIEKDNPQQLVDFLADAYVLDAQHYKHYKTELGVLMDVKMVLTNNGARDQNKNISRLQCYTPSFILTKTQVMAGFFGALALGVSLATLYAGSDTIIHNPKLTT